MQIKSICSGKEDQSGKPLWLILPLLLGILGFCFGKVLDFSHEEESFTPSHRVVSGYIVTSSPVVSIFRM